MTDLFTCVLRQLMTHHHHLDETRRWKPWSRRRGAHLISVSLLLFFLSCRLANGESLPCFPKPIWAQLLSGSCLLKWWSGCVMHQSAPVLRPAFLHLFVTISVSLLYPRQVSCNTFYLIWRNLLDKAHGAGKLFRNIWYLPSLTRHWNKIIFILLLHALWSQFVLGLALAAAFPPLCIANG